jgi:hypothetical protein
MAKGLLGKYIIPMTLADGNIYYAYRYLANDLTSKPIVVNRTKTINLAAYIGKHADVSSISGDIVDGNTTNLGRVNVKNVEMDKTYEINVKLADATEIVLSVHFK